MDPDGPKTYGPDPQPKVNVHFTSILMQKNEDYKKYNEI
jgi:hypothetical protein